MKIVAQFDPTEQQFTVQTAINNGSTIVDQQQGTINTGITSGYGKILVINQTNCDLAFTFPSSTFTDYIPARSYRIFELTLPSWVINWTAYNFPPFFVQPNVSQRVSRVTLISYAESENVGPIESVTNTNNLWTPADTIIQDPQSGIVTGGNGTAKVTLTPGTYIDPFTGIQPLVYLQQIAVAMNQTASSSDHADIRIILNAPQSLGGSWTQAVHANDASTGNGVNNVYVWNFTPALASNSLINPISVQFDVINAAGAGVSGPGCYVSAVFYHA